MTDKANRFTAAAAGGGPRHLAGDKLLDDEDDFDALLAASSFGSAQARAIREQTPAAAREHAQRVVDGEELCAPPEGDVDDAVSGLVYGIAHNVVPGPSPVALDALEHTSLMDEHRAMLDLLSDLHRESSQQAHRIWVYAACSTDLLWPDHRASLLQALVDHDAFDELRPDVAWRIVDYIFDVPRPPRVLSQCFELVVNQLDVEALAVTWQPYFGERLKHRSLEPQHLFGDRLSKRALTTMWVANAGLSGAPVFALHPPPRSPELATAPPRRQLGGEFPPHDGGGSEGGAKKRRTWSGVVVLAMLTALVIVNATGIRTVISVSLGALSVGAVLFERVYTLWRRE